MTLPSLCVVDTNVPKVANLAANPDSSFDVPPDCVLACVKAIDHVVKTKGLIIDDGDEIFDEYRQQLSMSGQPGPGDHFMKWVHDNRWGLPNPQRVSITRAGNSYKEFPTGPGLNNFDPSDRKFVAVANAHSRSIKPPILQATDSKWWGWKDALVQVSITVHFVCCGYIKTKYEEKMRGT